MESVLKTIKKDKLFKAGDVVGVACSGGIDSICLLHYLNSIREDLDIEIVAVNIDHQIRPTSADDTAFVANFCRKNRIRCYKFKVNALEIAKEQKICLEEAARIARYKAFDGLVEKGYVDKIALGHHTQDQAETVLLNIFRGAGLSGASGMKTVQNHYVRPMLNTTKDEIYAYASINNLEHVEDETNGDNEYSRNFLRNEIMPKLRQYWKNIDNNLINFSKICKQDDEYIESQISFDDLVFEKNLARIPLYEFAYPESITNRILRKAFNHLDKLKDIEKKHLDLIKDLVASGQNGTKINLPNNMKASLEYDYLTLSVTEKKEKPVPKDFKTGETIFEHFGKIKIKKTSKFILGNENEWVIDAKKLPQTAKWRTRELGDVFAKFGSGEKKLKDYFIDIKVPNRIRSEIPVLADGKEIYCVLGYEISDKVKVDANTKMVYVIKLEKEKTN
ncbi:MAG: tRNA lysidine(34) synthetase TilS [Christensenellales bacterium]